MLKIENLSLHYKRDNAPVLALRDVSLSLEAGTSLGVVGESGSGKSTLALAVLNLLPENAHRTDGRILFEGKNVFDFSPRDLRRWRGGDVGIVFQDPFSSLNPVLTVGDQVDEVLAVHRGGRNRSTVLALFDEVKLSNPQRIYGAYPHQLSGGQRQRVVLAMALAGQPKLLIADEPTTALDVTVQRDILELLDGLRRSRGMALLFVTHNLGLLLDRTDRLAVMYAGSVVEMGPTVDLLKDPRHPYTQGLLSSLPRLTERRSRLSVLAGAPPDPSHLPGGCAFHPRCPKIFDPCSTKDPRGRFFGERSVACHLYREAP